MQGNGVPASMKFTLGETQNLMPAINLRSRGVLGDSVALSRSTVAQAAGRVGEGTAAVPCCG